MLRSEAIYDAITICSLSNFCDWYDAADWDAPAFACQMSRVEACCRGGVFKLPLKTGIPNVAEVEHESWKQRISRNGLRIVQRFNGRAWAVYIDSGVARIKQPS